MTYLDISFIPNLPLPSLSRIVTYNEIQYIIEEDNGHKLTFIKIYFTKRIELPEVINSHGNVKGRYEDTIV